MFRISYLSPYRQKFLWQRLNEGGFVNALYTDVKSFALLSQNIAEIINLAAILAAFLKFSILRFHGVHVMKTFIALARLNNSLSHRNYA